MRKGPARRAVRRVAAASFIPLFFLLMLPIAAAHDITRPWQYDRSLWKHGWDDHESLDDRHLGWHRNNPTFSHSEHEAFHHDALIDEHRSRHHHRVLDHQSGEASWYDYEGSTGACGQRLTGAYAAHPSWPCGTLVSVKAGDRYIFVRVLDRGPYSNGRIIDLSREAFDRLGNTASGTMWVEIFRLED